MKYRSGNALYEIQENPLLEDFLISHRGSTLLLALIVILVSDWLLFYGSPCRKNKTIVSTVFVILNISSVYTFYDMTKYFPEQELYNICHYILPLLATDIILLFKMRYKTSNQVIRPIMAAIFLLFSLDLTFIYLNQFTPVFTAINWGSSLSK